jgi:hypothetical protein
MVSQLAKKLCRLLWYPKVHCRIHDISSVLSFLSQTNSIHALLSYFFEIHFNIIQGEHKVFSWLQTFIRENYMEYKHIFYHYLG